MGLREEIAQKQKQLEELELQLTKDKRKIAIRDLSDVSDAEKIKKFDDIFNFALSIIESVEEKGYTNEDDEHYAYEEIMSVIAKDRKAFWDYFNEII